MHLEKFGLKCMKNLRSLMSVSRGQALSDSSVEQGVALIPHPFSFLNLFYKDQLQVESWSPGLGQAPVCNRGKKEKGKPKGAQSHKQGWHSQLVPGMRGLDTNT